jgi:staphyloferrin B biosynthesis citrate synthase
MSDSLEFRRRLLAGERLLGTFIKLPAASSVEVVAAAGFDFIVIDAEHAPLGRAEIDHLLLAAKAVRIPALVRVSPATAATISAALDDGAAGIVAPHVASVQAARALAAAARFRGGGRGYSGSTRAAGYGAAGMAETIAAADASTSVVAQIEDAEALEVLDSIMAEPGLDVIFLGRADLAVALSASGVDHPAVASAVERIAACARAAAKPLMAFMTSANEMEALSALGVTVFVVGSDQSFIAQQARAVCATWRGSPGQVGARR